MNSIAAKVESLLALIRPGSNHDENVIDLQKTFSATGIDILPVVIKMLELEASFPTSRIQTKEGIKYHELEFFQTNISSSNTTPDTTTQPTTQPTYHPIPDSKSQSTTQPTHQPTTQPTTQPTKQKEDKNSQETLFTRLDMALTISFLLI